MKELDPLVLFSVFYEMLGPWLWFWVIAISTVTAGFVALLLRERGIVARRLVRTQALGLLGGIAALVLMVEVSSSGYTDAGGPADWILIALVFVAGMVGSTILFYTVAGWHHARRSRLAS